MPVIPAQAGIQSGQMISCLSFRTDLRLPPFLHPTTYLQERIASANNLQPEFIRARGALLQVTDKQLITTAFTNPP